MTVTDRNKFRLLIDQLGTRGIVLMLLYLAIDGDRCRKMGVRPSMGTVGDAYDNAMAESFFASLECELLDRRSFKSKIEARQAVFTWIEGWYNRVGGTRRWATSRPSTTNGETRTCIANRRRQPPRSAQRRLNPSLENQATTCP